MTHLIFVFYLLALMSGTAALSQSVLFYQRYRKRVIRRFLVFLLSLCLILISFIVRAYSEIAALPKGGAAASIAWIAMAAGGLTFIFVAPYFYGSLLGFDLSRGWRFAFSGLDAFVVGWAIVDLLRPGEVLPALFLSAMLLAMILLGIVLIVVKLGSVSDRILRLALTVFLWTTAGFVPLLLVDWLLGRVRWLAPVGFLNGTALPLYLLTVSGLSILFGLRYLNRPAYYEGEDLSDYFLAAYRITAREREIILQLLEGTRTAEIGERLFISAKTVENHVYNIYQKLGVRNRVQLFQLIRANSA